MKRQDLVVLFLALSVTSTVLCNQGDIKDEHLANYTVVGVNHLWEKHLRDEKVAKWGYQTNIRPDTQEQMVEVRAALAEFEAQVSKSLSSFAWKSFENADLKRMFQFLSFAGMEALPSPKFKELKNTTASMESIYSTTKICPYKSRGDAKCAPTLQLDPDITDVMAQSRDYDELLYTWKEWHERAGRPIRPFFPTYVRLSNEGAKLNEFKDTSEMWIHEFESPTFESDLQKLWQTVKPFYQQLHAYVRRKLMAVYKDKIRADGPIPAHLLGDMWSQKWDNIEEFVKPFPSKPNIDITHRLVEKKYTVVKMAQEVDKFFTSIGLLPVPDSFWQQSMFTRPDGDREVVCQSGTWDFFDGKDYRVKLCGQVNMETFNELHHEFGHLQYSLQYREQPTVFKEAANPGFDEAIGDTIALSASGATHLKKLDLLPDYEDNTENNLNSLMHKALTHVAFLPFGYITDLWRWKVFRGEVTPDNYNAKWWDLRKEYQGIEPAVERSENDFDPGAKYHVAADVNYVRYFFSYIAQFQFHRALCEEAGQYVPGDAAKPLHKCDIYQNKAAGKLFGEMLQLGRSKHWTEAMSVITRGKSKTIDASAIVEYFQPLIDYLTQENKKNNEHIGWRV